MYLVHSDYQRKCVRTFLESEDFEGLRLVIMDLARMRVWLMCSVYPEHELNIFISSNRTGNRRLNQTVSSAYAEIVYKDPRLCLELVYVDLELKSFICFPIADLR